MSNFLDGIGEFFDKFIGLFVLVGTIVNILSISSIALTQNATAVIPEIGTTSVVDTVPFPLNLLVSFLTNPIGFILTLILTIIIFVLLFMRNGNGGRR